MGEMSVAANGETLLTLLGSCIGVALFDRRRHVGGLAHVMLPKSQGDTEVPGKFVNTAVPKLIEEMHAVAGTELNLIAKLAGGASMFATTIPARIGIQNIEACEGLLRQIGIPIVARHCGGETSRRMYFDTTGGKVVIEIGDEDPVEL